MYNVDELVKDLIGRDATLCKDYPGLVKWSIEKIEKWTDSWTDYNITDPGILFINAYSYLYDIVNYVLDETFLNNILRYTKSMDMLYIMSKFAGVTLPGYYSSVASVIIENTLDEEVLLPEGFCIFAKDEATNNRIYFYSLADIRIAPGKSSGGQFIEGERGRIDTTFGVFYENSRFELVIPSPKIGLNSIYLYAQFDFEDAPSLGYLDDEHTMRRVLQVDDALLNLADQPCFSAYYAQSKVVIQLCPGMADFLTPETPITILYGVPFGISANVGTVSARPLTDIFIDGKSVSGKLNYTILRASGASVPYGLEDTRVFIGNNVWRPETLIVNQDFDKLEDTEFPTVCRFTVVQEKGSEDMTVYVVPSLYKEDGTPQTDSDVSVLLHDIEDYGKDLMFGGVKLHVEKAKPFPMDFVIECVLAINTSDTDDIRNAIIEILNSYLDRETQERNMYFRRGKVITLLESGIDAIYSVSLTYPIVDRQAKDDEFYVLGNVITNFIQNNEFEDWE